MIFKTPGVEEEFSRAEPAIIGMLLYADWYSKINFGHEVFVTDMDRSQEEYDRIYSKDMVEGRVAVWEDESGVKHYGGPRPHLYDPRRGFRTRAGDLGLLIPPHTQKQRLLLSEARMMEEHFRARFKRRDGKFSALLHDVGVGQHLHIQAEIV